MSTLVGTRRGSAPGTLLLSFGLRFTAIAAVAFLAAVVILTSLLLANLDVLFAGLMEVQDPILIPARVDFLTN